VTSLTVLLEPLHMVIDSSQNNLKLSNTESTHAVGLDAFSQFLLKIVDHLFADLDAVRLVLTQRGVHAEGLDATFSLLDLDLLFLGDGDIDLTIAVAYSIVDDAETAEVGAAAVANFFEPLKSLLAQEIACRGVQDEHAVVEIQGHQFSGDRGAGVHEGGRGLGAFPSRAEETEVNGPLGTAAVQLVIDCISDLNREIEEAGSGRFATWGRYDDGGRRRHVENVIYPEECSRI
jgi:hypothetical protein